MAAIRRGRKTSATDVRGGGRVPGQRSGSDSHPYPVDPSNTYIP